MTRSVTFYATAATDRMNAGFTSKAGQKEALADLNRAWDLVKRELRDACLAERFERPGFPGLEMTAEVKAVYWNFADYPHQFKAKHAELVRAAFGDRFEELLATAAELAELRDVIKGAEIVPPVKDETKVRAERVVASIKDLMERRKAQYLEAIDLSEVLGDGVVIRGLTANSHWVVNEHGTGFVRTFFYLRGKLTPLNTILAGAEEAARRAEEAR